MLQKDGNYVKYIKDEFLPLARARSWNTGPIPVGSATKMPEAAGSIQTRAELVEQQVKINLIPPDSAKPPSMAAGDASLASLAVTPESPASTPPPVGAPSGPASVPPPV